MKISTRVFYKEHLKQNFYLKIISYFCHKIFLIYKQANYKIGTSCKLLFINLSFMNSLNNNYG